MGEFTQPLIDYFALQSMTLLCSLYGKSLAKILPECRARGETTDSTVVCVFVPYDRLQKFGAVPRACKVAGSVQ